MGDPRVGSSAGEPLGIDSEGVYMTADPNFVWGIASITPPNVRTPRVAIAMEKSRLALQDCCSRKESTLMIFAQDQTAHSLSTSVLFYDILARATCRGRSLSCPTRCLCRAAEGHRCRLDFCAMVCPLTPPMYAPHIYALAFDCVPRALSKMADHFRPRQDVPRGESAPTTKSTCSLH